MNIVPPADKEKPSKKVTLLFEDGSRRASLKFCFKILMIAQICRTCLQLTKA